MKSPEIKYIKCFIITGFIFAFSKQSVCQRVGMPVRKQAFTTTATNAPGEKVQMSETIGQADDNSSKDSSTVKPMRRLTIYGKSKEMVRAGRMLPIRKVPVARQEPAINEEETH